MSAVDQFIAELRGNSALAVHAAAVGALFEALDLEGDGSPDAVRCFEAVLWIISQNASIDERVKALHRLFSLPRGPTKGNLRRAGERIIVTELS